MKMTYLCGPFHGLLAATTLPIARGYVYEPGEDGVWRLVCRGDA